MRRLLALLCVGLLSASCADAPSKDGDSQTPSMPPPNNTNPLYNSQNGGFVGPGSGGTISTSVSRTKSLGELSEQEQATLCSDLQAAAESTGFLTRVCEYVSLFNAEDVSLCNRVRSTCLEQDQFDLCDDFDISTFENCDATVDDLLACWQARADLVSSVDIPACEDANEANLSELERAFEDAENPPACAAIEACESDDELRPRPGG